MKKRLLLSITAMFLILSCSKVNDKISDSLDFDKDKIKEQISLHSKGLDYFFNKLKDASVNIKAAGATTGPLNPIISLKDGFMKKTIHEFLEAENIPKTGMGILSENLKADGTVILSTIKYKIQFSDSFYQLSLEIVDVPGSNLLEVKSNLETVINSPKFLALPKIEKQILFMGAETYIDSYKYWEAKETQWEIVASSKNPNKVKAKKGFWGRVRRLAGADAKGAIAGGIGGAIGGAVVGGMAGGVGAGPGAITGAVGGAISVGVTNSILEAMGRQVIFEKFSRDEETVTIKNFKIPRIWTKIEWNTRLPIPSNIEYKNGLFTTP